VIVGGSSPNTADYHVVAGVMEASSGTDITRPLIEVIRPADDNRSYYDLAAANPPLFSFYPQTQRRWAETHIMAIREADTVLTVGGMSGTYQAGLIAIVARKRLVPVASFGGASARLHQALEMLSHREAIGDLRILNGPWGDHALETAMRLAEIGRATRLLLIHGRNDDRYKLEVWLQRQLGITNITVMQEEYGAGLTLPEKFETLASRVDGAIALATPDDVGGPADENTRPRARQNVWLEVGWFWGRLGRNKVMVIRKANIEIPSDLQGLEYYSYNDTPEEAGDRIRAFVSRLQQEI
jgi:hypothetical protein